VSEDEWDELQEKLQEMVLEGYSENLKKIFKPKEY